MRRLWLAAVQVELRGDDLKVFHSIPPFDTRPDLVTALLGDLNLVGDEQAARNPFDQQLTLTELQKRPELEPGSIESQEPGEAEAFTADSDDYGTGLHEVAESTQELFELQLGGEAAYLDPALASDSEIDDAEADDADTDHEGTEVLDEVVGESSDSMPELESLEKEEIADGERLSGSKDDAAPV